MSLCGRVYLEKIVKERVLFEIKSRGGGAFYGIKERGRSFWQSCHPPSSFTGNRGGGTHASAAADSAALGHGGGRGEGKKEVGGAVA